MSDKNEERIADLERHEREQRPKQYGLDEGMCNLARLIGLPDTPEGILEHFRREERRRKLRIAGLGSKGCEVEIKPAHPGCQFQPISDHVRSDVRRFDGDRERGRIRQERPRAPFLAIARAWLVDDVVVPERELGQLDRR